MITILTGVRWYLNVVLICNSLMTSDDEHFFICLLASFMSSFVKCLFTSFAHFEWACLFFSCKSVWVLCKSWISALCQMGKLQKFFPILLVADWLMTVSFAMQKPWSLIRSHLSILAFVANAFGVLFMKSLPPPMSWMVLPRLSSWVLWCQVLRLSL